MIAPSYPARNLEMRILLIEDNHVSRQLMSDYLTDCGYTLLSLEDGSSVDLALAEFKPHIILLDLKLPNVDGFTVLQQLQQKVGWKPIPVIVISAFAFRADQQRALELGARRYFVKPVKLTELTQAIREEIGYSVD
jgi:two-component system cell cycle response regulator DivK